MVTSVEPAIPRPAGRPVLRPDQGQGLRAVVRHLRRPNARALYVAATGTGKTLVSIRAADELGARLVLVVVPTLDLATQTALAWRRDGHLEHMVVVSSMDAAAHGLLAARRVGSTSSPQALAALMSVVGEGEDQLPALTVISTYDSLDKIEATQHTRYTVPPFDLAIMDEAHRIAGRADKKWAVINDAARIHAERRLYMTATPRSFAAPDLTDSASTTRRQPRPVTESAVDTAANSMDNEAVYGKKVFEYPLAQAIADGVAADYRIVVPAVTDTELRARLNLPAPGTPAAGTGPDDALRTTALHLAVLNAMTKHSMRRVLVFFHLVEDSIRFTRELPHTLRRLRKADPDCFPGLAPDVFHVHGDHTAEQRTDIFARFAASPRAILTNAKVIAEGIDIPSVDAVVFADPTSSITRCVQGLGRALRLDVSGKTASLIVPVYIPPSDDPENILGTPYEPVWAITTALASHDHRILERLPNKANRLTTETSRLIQHRWHFDYTIHPERIARAMDLIAFNPRGALNRTRREGLASAQAFHDTYGHLDVPADHTDPAGFELGRFITTMRDAATAGRLEPDWTAELDALGMIWDKHAAAWRARLTATADYHHAHGHLAAPATTALGGWLAEQRSLATRGRLDTARAADLAAIDADWQLPYGPDWHRKYHLVRRHVETGQPLTPDTHAGTINLGSWAARQLTAWSTLDPCQHRLLAALDLTPATSDLTPRPTTRRTFAQTVQILELFLHRERRAPTARETITVDGDTVKIGPWFAKTRTKMRAGQIKAEQAQLVAALFDGDWTDENPVPAFG
ncbi:DEAD/DEAH box helicase [Streptomyces wuyuanensis]|uniref:Helicase associated domain-containing protein n=1 Tax=Streptomyces wuyuanensis TaxID=1196353 RepID=A0A1H0DXJ7_9ACTN|nr:DEAD/DEAH box helicase [Streptomyces wuyuanensis]SDN74753.1 Helicase associated domain-containing protein [Streptomyces wuyuanensis]